MGEGQEVVVAFVNEHNVDVVINKGDIIAFLRFRD